MAKRTSMKAFARKAKSDEKKALASLDSFQNLVAKMGLGTDNISSGANYGFNPITRQRMLLEWIHRGSWLGGVAVDLIGDDMTRGGVDIKGKLAPEDQEEINEEIVRTKVWQKINEGIRWGRLYGGAIGIMLVDGHDPSTPLNIDRVGRDQFKGLMILDRWQVEPQLDNVIGSQAGELGPDIGLPRYYKVGQMAPIYRNKKVHYSRVVRFMGTQLPLNQAVTEMMWGLSVYERLYDRMVAFDSATTGAAQLVYKAYIRTYSIEGLREIASAGGKALDGLVKYLEMMRRFQSVEGITLLDAKDKFEGHTHQAFGGISDTLMQFGQQLSGALQIPLVRLFGQSPAGLNATGESDLRMYYDGILQHQESDLKIPTTAIYRMTAQSLAIKLPDGFGIGFKSLWQLTEKEKAEIASNNEDTVQKAHEGGLITRQTALKELRQGSTVHGVFSNITDEEINDAETELPPLPTDVEVAAIKEGEEVPEGREEPKEISEGGGKKQKLLKQSNDRRTRDASTAQLAYHHGLYMVVETPRGTTRRGYGWEATMPADYGYIRSTTGADGDQLDSYLGPDPASPYVYVIDQMTRPNGSPSKFDEHKVMLGYPDQQTAVADYILSHTDGQNLIASVTPMSMDQFKNWLATGDLSKPLGGTIQ